MRSVAVTNFEAWREAARVFLSNDLQPEEVRFVEGPQGALFENRDPLPAVGSFVLKVPKTFPALAQAAGYHRDPERWNLLYRTLYRIVHGERHLLENEIDPDVRALRLMETAVDRDIHKMHAFVRFRKIASETDQFVAWYRPDHHILEQTAPWFARRFGSMHWTILTPDRSAYWDTRALRFGPGVPQSEAPDGDSLEGLWRAYYSSIFNPARANRDAMVKELPVRHWATLPEADLIPKLLMEAPAREEKMRELRPASAEAFVPEDHHLPVLAEAIRGCQGCSLYRHATQAVFGEGPKNARIMFVGEQPGDQEDLEGKPFVGPAGRLWNQALVQAGLDRRDLYVTNAVKHFKYEERGPRRIHKKPDRSEVAACRAWLSAEIEQVNPEMIVALGATAALSVGGREFAIQRERGKFLPIGANRQLLVTVHPSYLLRVPDAQRPAEMKRFVEDLRLVRDSRSVLAKK